MSHSLLLEMQEVTRYPCTVEWTWWIAKNMYVWERFFYAGKSNERGNCLFFSFAFFLLNSILLWMELLYGVFLCSTFPSLIIFTIKDVPKKKLRMRRKKLFSWQRAKKLCLVSTCYDIIPSVVQNPLFLFPVMVRQGTEGNPAADQRVKKDGCSKFEWKFILNGNMKGIYCPSAFLHRPPSLPCKSSVTLSLVNRLCGIFMRKPRSKKKEAKLSPYFLRILESHEKKRWISCTCYGYMTWWCIYHFFSGRKKWNMHAARTKKGLQLHNNTTAHESQSRIGYLQQFFCGRRREKKPRQGDGDGDDDDDDADEKSYIYPSTLLRSITSFLPSVVFSERSRQTKNIYTSPWVTEPLSTTMIKSVKAKGKEHTIRKK